MKKTSLKSKLMIVFGIIMVCLIFSSSIFIPKTENSFEESLAINELTNPSEFINGLKSDKLYPSIYNMTEKYPLASENQTSSNLCWIYASFKVLESSLMIQKGEYHNFSEMGSAYLYFTKITQNKEDGVKKIDISGNFNNFNILSQNFGVIYENTFSNDLYFDINEQNYENYSYVLDYVDTTLMNGIKSINFSDEPAYVSLDQSTKIQVMKEYIYNYGGIFAGIERGIISNSSKTYIRTDENSDSELDGFIPTRHAVCLVGWSDSRQAFLALNSWGTSFNLFWVPYDYSNMYKDVYGYVCTDVLNAKVENLSSTAGGEDGFYQKINSKFVDPIYDTSTSFVYNNLFIYNENIALRYKISNIEDFDNIFVYVYKGLENVTNQFLIDFIDESMEIEISSNNPLDLNDGYVIKIMDYDTLIGFRDFYVFNGNEVSYIQLIESNKDRTTDSVLFNNNLASGTYTQTYYIYNNENNDYILELYLSGFNGYTKNNNVAASTNVFELVSKDNETVAENSRLIRATIDTNTGVSLNANFFRLKISNLSIGNEGKTFMISLSMVSKQTGAQTDYYFIFIVGSNNNAKTKVSNKIVYELDGGTNNQLNLNRYPNFELENQDENFSFALNKPTKYNSTFIGWFIDPEYSVEITEINKSISSLLGKVAIYNENMEIIGYYSNLLKKEYSDDIIVYAKWESSDVEYFDIDFDIKEIIDHDGQARTYSDGMKIIYGDSVRLKLTFTPYLENLTSYKFVSKYEYKFKNSIVEADYLSGVGEEVDFDNLFASDNLVCGDYSASIMVVMVISHQFSIEKEMSLNYKIEKKTDVTVSYDNSSLHYVYDKQAHLPSVSFSGVYQEDMNDFSFEFNRGAVTESGTYEFSVKSISNPNYELSGNVSEILSITTKGLTISFTKTEKVYNGNYQLPDYKISGAIDDEFVAVSLVEKNNRDMKNVSGYTDNNYRVTVNRISNRNYHFEGITECEFKIIKANITVSFEDITERFTVASNNRKKVVWDIDGELFDSEESLNITYTTLGENATRSGKYPIVGGVIPNEINKNYNITFNDAIYTILGYYYVYYTLPNGESYVETVNEGEEPAGITDEIYKLPFLSKFEYDKELTGNGLTDLYVKVSIKSYSWLMWFGIGIVTIIVLYFVITKKDRKNKIR